MKVSERFQKYSGIAAVFALVVACFVVLRPFISAMLWAAILCFSTWPLYVWIRREACRGRNGWAALLMTIIIAFFLVAPFILAAWTFTENIANVASMIKDVKMSPEAPPWIKGVPLFGAQLGSFWTDVAHDKSKLLEVANPALGKSSGWLIEKGKYIGAGILELVLSVFICFFLYRDGEAFVRKATAGAEIIIGSRTHELFSVLKKTMNSIVFGLVGTAIVQAIAAAIGFWIAGVPSAFLLALLTLLFAFFPAGTVLVWFPVAVWIYFEHGIGWGVFLFLWGTFVISGVDNVVRPYFISRGTNLPFILIFLGVLGGLVAFGFLGLFIGPALLAVAYSLLESFLSSNVASGQDAGSAATDGRSS